ncbi:MAG TPA: T9SS type A sorting domain-containing protein, partial [Brumimicrobium sp.]|nr:T9SS type A sorting domain-containing protein [Brumimicrobium sp.]
GLGFKKGVVRAVHDMRAAIRFLRKSVAEEGNPYGINPNIIVVGGYSAGAILANHVTYLDNESKIPAELVDYFSDQGGLEGNTGNPGYNSVPQMVLSMCGAILNTSWMEAGDQPYFGMHNLDDPTVPNLEAQPNIGMSIPVTLQGDSLMYTRALDVNVPALYKSYPGNGHCDFPLESVELIFDFLHEQICEESLSINEYETTIDFSVYPNLTNEILFVEVPKNSQDLDVSIVSLVGQTIHSEKMNANQDKVIINSSAFETGVYIVKLMSKDGVEAIRKVVVR